MALGTLLWPKGSTHIFHSPGLQLCSAESSLACEWIAQALLGVALRCLSVAKGPQAQTELTKK